MVASEFTLFEMEIESGFVYSSELNQSDFSMGPKRFDAVQMRLTPDKFIFAVTDTEILVITERVLEAQ